MTWLINNCKVQRSKQDIPPFTKNKHIHSIVPIRSINENKTEQITKCTHLKEANNKFSKVKF